jgi:hypothetical protein
VKDFSLGRRYISFDLSRGLDRIFELQYPKNSEGVQILKVKSSWSVCSTRAENMTGKSRTVRLPFLFFPTVFVLAGQNQKGRDDKYGIPDQKRFMEFPDHFIGILFSVGKIPNVKMGFMHLQKRTFQYVVFMRLFFNIPHTDG